MKKITSSLLSLCLVFSLSSVSFATEYKDDSLSLSVPFNESITSEMMTREDERNLLNNENKPQNITLLLEKEGNNYLATGVLEKKSGKHSYSIEGELQSVQMGESKGLIGFMSGELDNGEYVSMDLHCIPNSSDVFIYLSVGYVTSDSDCETYIFGEVFPSMNSLVDEYAESQEKNIMIEDDDISLLSSDYNVSLRDIKYTAGRLNNGNSVALMSASIFTPKRIGCNESAKSYIKLNGNLANAKVYIQGTKPVAGLLSVWATKGTCTLSSRDNNMELKDLDPGNENFKIELPIPYVWNGAVKILPWSFNIGFDTIKTSVKKNSGSFLYNEANWNHNYSNSVDWGTDGPASSKNGYVGSCTITYHDNDARSTSLQGNGTITYTYMSQYGATQYTGSFTVYSGVTTNILVDNR